MFFIISKVLSFLISPAVWIVTLLLFAIIFKKKSKIYLIIMFVFFILITNSFLFNEAVSRWETKPIPIEKIGTYDYAIVLGGFSAYDTTYSKLNLMVAGDRIWQTLQLYETKKVKKIIITGGSGQLLNQDKTEADKVKEFLITLNIPEDDIVMEMQSRNTHENAANTASWLNKHHKGAKCLLVTSAWHMPRSLGCFKKENVNVTAYPAHYFTMPRSYQIDNLVMPQLNILDNWGILLREWIGYFTYKITGYI